MHNVLTKGALTTLLFVLLASPAAAQGYGPKGKGKEMKEINAEIRLLKKELKAEIKARHEDDDDDEEEKRTALSVCLQTAAKAHVQALTAARKAREASLQTARKTYQQALHDAEKARRDANLAARATFRASDKGIEAQVALETALYNATVTWLRAKHAAKTSWDAAKPSAEETWKTAKAKADADFAAAKAQCQAQNQPPAADTTAPGSATLSLSGATHNSIVVSWTAPGDDGSTGTAAAYDLRYSTTAITDATFASATQVSGEPAPAVAGTSQSMTVTGLTASTAYFFAMKSQDEAPNVSAISNAPSLATTAAPDTTAPAAITTLSLSAPTASSLVVAWTATGDDGTTGTATSYDIRYATVAIVSEADFTAATQVSGEPAPTAAGTSQSMTVSGLNATTTYFFAAKATDEANNTSGLSNVPSLATL